MVHNTYNTSKIKVSEQFVYPLSVRKFSTSKRNAQQQRTVKALVINTSQWAVGA